jgi:hypothetical protein
MMYPAGLNGLNALNSGIIPNNNFNSHNPNSSHILDPGFNRNPPSQLKNDASFMPNRIPPSVNPLINSMLYSSPE